MNLAKYIVLGIVSGIFNMYPISYMNKIMIYQNMFNTKIFDDSELVGILNGGLLVSILVIYSKDIMLFFRKVMINSLRKDKELKKKLRKSYRKYMICMVITMAINVLVYVLVRVKVDSFKKLAYCYVVTAILIGCILGKNGIKKDKDISYIDAILIGLGAIVIVIPSNTVLLGNLLIASRLKIAKKTSLRYSLTCQLPIIFMDFIPHLFYYVGNTTYLLEVIIGLVISVFVSLEIFKSLKYMYYSNRLYRLAIYTLLFAIFIFYWFG